MILLTYSLSQKPFSAASRGVMPVTMTDSGSGRRSGGMAQ